MIPVRVVLSKFFHPSYSARFTVVFVIFPSFLPLFVTIIPFLSHPCHTRLLHHHRSLSFLPSRLVFTIPVLSAYTVTECLCLVGPDLQNILRFIIRLS